MQIGDGGYHAQMSMLPKVEDSKTASSLFDFVFGYSNRTTAMTIEEIEQAVENFANGARRAREAGCDGVEIAAHKGYLIHQFLNPGINRRTDAYGGSVENRFRLLREVIVAVRRAVGEGYLLGVRLSAVDFNYLPVNLRLPVVFPLRHYFIGNSLTETLGYGRELAKLGVDYLHITSGFGFIHPRESPGDWPVDEYRLFANAVRHLSAKAKARAILLNALPRPLLSALAGIGWRYRPSLNIDYARAFKDATGLPVIGNGALEGKGQLEAALEAGQCDLIAMARPLLANPNLLSLYQSGADLPDKPCSYCNRCSAATAVLPLGCYDRRRFASQEAMEAQISGGPAGRRSRPRSGLDGVACPTLLSQLDAGVQDFDASLRRLKYSSAGHVRQPYFANLPLDLVDLIHGASVTELDCLVVSAPIHQPEVLHLWNEQQIALPAQHEGMGLAAHHRRAHQKSR